jgi:hypothetical protein
VGAALLSVVLVSRCAKSMLCCNNAKKRDLENCRSRSLLRWVLKMKSPCAVADDESEDNWLIGDSDVEVSG